MVSPGLSGVDGVHGRDAKLSPGSQADIKQPRADASEPYFRLAAIRSLSSVTQFGTTTSWYPPDSVIGVRSAFHL
jgi:hypothetical protein